jgi:probable HAF family extracellular repeat protein
VGQTITVPGYRFTTALNINAAGQVIGYASDPTARNPTHAFLFDPTSGTHDIGALFDRNTSSKPVGLNQAGQVFGQLTGGQQGEEVFFYDPNTGAHQAISLPGYRLSSALGMDSAGQIIGYLTDPTARNPTHAFLFDPTSGTHDIGALFDRNTSSKPVGFNQSGEVFGQLTGGRQGGEAFFYDPKTGTAQAITLRGYRESTALDTNAAGQVIGYVTDPTGHNPTHAFLFDLSKGTTDIGALFDRNTSSKPVGVNQAGQVFGQLTGGRNGGEAFFYDSKTGTAHAITLRGYRESTALGMNAVGQVIGYVTDPTGRNPTHAFLFDPSKGTTDIGALFDRNTSSKPVGFNQAGEIFGQLTGGRQGGEAFFYDPKSGTAKAITLPGYRETTALDINAAGQVIGYAVDPTGRNPTHAFLFDPSKGTTDIGVLFGRNTSSKPSGFNEAGQVFGQLTGGKNGGEVFFYDPNTGAHEGISLSEYRLSTALGMNSAGQVFGSLHDPRALNPTHAFAFDPTDGTFDIGALFNRSTSSQPVGFNEAGQVFGQLTGGKDNGEAFFATPTAAAPEPGTLTLAGIGFLGLLGIGRRFRNQVA